MDNQILITFAILPDYLELKVEVPADMNVNDALEQLVEAGITYMPGPDKRWVVTVLGDDRRLDIQKTFEENGVVDGMRLRIIRCDEDDPLLSADMTGNHEAMTEERIYINFILASGTTVEVTVLPDMILDDALCQLVEAGLLHPLRDRMRWNVAVEGSCRMLCDEMTFTENGITDGASLRVYQAF